MNKQEAINALKEHNQEHVIKRLEALDEVSAKKLIAQVASIDWSVVESINHKAEDNSSDRKVEPLEAVEIKDIKANKDKYIAKGIEAIKAGKVADNVKSHNFGHFLVGKSCAVKEHFVCIRLFNNRHKGERAIVLLVRRL